MTWVYGIISGVGVVLTVWAVVVNPAGATMPPVPLPVGATRVTSGPYRWLRHPMYVGQWLTIVGCAGLAAGVWNAIALGLLAWLMWCDWCAREGQKRKVS